MEGRSKRKVIFLSSVMVVGLIMQLYLSTNSFSHRKSSYGLYGNFKRVALPLPPSLDIYMSPLDLKQIPSGCGNNLFERTKTASTFPLRSATANWLLADDNIYSFCCLGLIAAAEGWSFEVFLGAIFSTESTSIW